MINRSFKKFGISERINNEAFIFYYDKTTKQLFSQEEFKDKIREMKTTYQQLNNLKQKRKLPLNMVIFSNASFMLNINFLSIILKLKREI